ncbi:hypothetical protein LMH73_020245 [Vibrio splendidus]|nr:hypothetical protein [Vibrio splendidus]MCC4881882.1 hypothetical protein [Vibrio splendidus]
MECTELELSPEEVLEHIVNASLGHLGITFRQITDWIGNRANINSRKVMHSTSDGNFFIIKSRDAIYPLNLYSMISSNIRDTRFDRIVNTHDIPLMTGDMDCNKGKENTSFYVLSSSIILVHDELGTAQDLHDVLSRKSCRVHATHFNVHIKSEGRTVESKQVTIGSAHEETHKQAINGMTLLNREQCDYLQVFVNHKGKALNAGDTK